MSKEFKEIIQQLSDINIQSGILQEVYIIEECAELIKESTKNIRSKNNKDNYIKEACDVLTTILVILYRENVTEDFIKNFIINKIQRASERSLHQEF